MPTKDRGSHEKRQDKKIKEIFNVGLLNIRIGIIDRIRTKRLRYLRHLNLTRDEDEGRLLEAGAISSEFC